MRFVEVRVWGHNQLVISLAVMLYFQGEISAQQIEWLSGIKTKNLNNCGRFTLAEDLSSIADITRVDLSNMNSLAGEVSCVGTTRELTHWVISRDTGSSGGAQPIEIT